MLKIEKIKKEIKNYDTNNNVYFGCYLANFESNIDYEESDCFKEILCSECLRLSMVYFNTNTSCYFYLLQ